ncbi:MAG: hypothetical protein WBJ59_02310 [Dysgonamonadaceae bacterium]|jgi:hypothetical protein
MLLNYPETGNTVARVDAYVNVEDITEEWISGFGEFAGRKHYGNDDF